MSNLNPQQFSGHEVGDLHNEALDARIRDPHMENYLREDDSASPHRGWEHLDRVEEQVLSSGKIHEPALVSRVGDKVRVMDGQHRALLAYKHGLDLPVRWHTN